MSVLTHLELSTARLPAQELERLEQLASLTPAGDDPRYPRVSRHAYGYIVFPGSFMDGTDPEGDRPLIDELPELAACVAEAQRQGCALINFDCDGQLPEEEK